MVIPESLLPDLEGLGRERRRRALVVEAEQLDGDDVEHVRQLRISRGPASPLQLGTVQVCVPGDQRVAEPLGHRGQVLKD